MPDTPSPSQAPLSQIVSATYNRQPPLPSQVPSFPQVVGVLALHRDGSVGEAPAGMKLQSPSALGRLHALQLSLQADVQHTPSTQYPDRHSALHEHASLLPLLGGPASPEQAGFTEASAGESGRSPARSWRPSLRAESLPPPVGTGRVAVGPVAALLRAPLAGAHLAHGVAGRARLCLRLTSGDPGSFARRRFQRHA
jgi:hypothetical protein